jgi:SAM-dependent methyltransferase
VTEQTARWIGDAFADNVEFSRLRALEGVWDENTCSLLGQRVAVQRGWRCLELGAGAGSIARWLADRVGPSGSVVAADLNCRFLVDMPGNVAVRPLDAADAEFGREEFDLIHHRSVLSYVSGRERVLARLVESLRPGGWLVSEEPDFQYRVVAGDSGDRLLARFFHALRLILAATGTDFSFAPRLVVLFRGLGLGDIDHLVRSHVAQGGSPMSEVIWRAVEPLRSQLLNVAGFTDEEVDRAVALLRSRDASWVDPAVISVFGRRPA